MPRIKKAKTARDIRLGINEARRQAGQGIPPIFAANDASELAVRAFHRIGVRYLPQAPTVKLAPIPKRGEQRPDLVVERKPPKGGSGISVPPPAKPLVPLRRNIR